MGSQIHWNLAQALRDLEWLLEEREVIHQDESLLPYRYDDWHARLACLEQNLEPLAVWLAASKSHFLGIYAERLFAFALHHFYQVEVLAEHHQLSDNTRTLGEVDALIRLPNGRILQIELATKFYLERPDLAPNNWIGPNKNDSLHKKITRARSHQLQILSLSSGKMWLHSVTNGCQYDANLVILGRRFWRLTDANCNRVLSPDARKHDFFGAWLPISELTPWLDHADLYEIQKPHWLATHPDSRLENAHKINDLSIVHARFEYDSRPILLQVVGRKKHDKSTAGWLFVVPNDW